MAKKQCSNNMRSNSLNPNNSSYRAIQNNHANQKNSNNIILTNNNSAYRGAQNNRSKQINENKSKK